MKLTFEQPCSFFWISFRVQRGVRQTSLTHHTQADEPFNERSRMGCWQSGTPTRCTAVSYQPQQAPSFLSTSYERVQEFPLLASRFVVPRSAEAPRLFVGTFFTKAAALRYTRVPEKTFIPVGTEVFVSKASRPALAPTQ